MGYYWLLPEVMVALTSINVEQLIMCECRGQFRAIVDGHMPISDVRLEGVICPHCKQQVKPVTIAGHSGGTFNLITLLERR